MHLSWRNCMEYRNDWPNDWSNCLIFGDLLTNMLLILRMRCSAVYLVNEILIFLESIKSPRSSTFCVVIKTDLRVYIENPNVLNKSTVAFILFIHYCSVSLQTGVINKYSRCDLDFVNIQDRVQDFCKNRYCVWVAIGHTQEFAKVLKRLKLEIFLMRDVHKGMFKINTGHPHIIFYCFEYISKRLHLEMSIVNQFI